MSHEEGCLFGNGTRFVWNGGADKKQVVKGALVEHVEAGFVAVHEREGSRVGKGLRPSSPSTYQPAGPVEFGFIEEMVGAAWRMRSAWAIETRMLDTNAPDPSGVPPVDRMQEAFCRESIAVPTDRVDSGGDTFITSVLPISS